MLTGLDERKKMSVFCPIDISSSVSQDAGFFFPSKKLLEGKFVIFHLESRESTYDLFALLVSLA